MRASPNQQREPGGEWVGMKVRSVFMDVEVVLGAGTSGSGIAEGDAPGT
jgi:hypothetical protein